MNYIRDFVGSERYAEEPSNVQRDDEYSGYNPIQLISDAKNRLKKKINSPIDLLDYYQSKKAKQQQEQQEYHKGDFRMFQPVRTQFDYMGQQLELQRHRQVKQQRKQNHQGKGKNPTCYEYEDLVDPGKVFPNPYIKYKIIPAEQEKMAVDATTVDNQKLTKGTLIVWDYHGGPNQHFYFKRVFPRENFYYIINASTGFAIEVPNSDTRDQVVLEMMPIDPNFNPKQGRSKQIWEINMCGKDLFTIVSFCGKCMDVKNDWMMNGTNVIQYANHNGKNQKWRIWPS